jgi:hypothetical protein
VRDGLDTSVKNGTYCGGYLIYGYKLVDTDKKGNKGTIHKVAVEEERAAVVRFIFEEYAKGTDKKEIADALNARGCTYKSKPFKFRTFEHWLSNEKYTGEFTHGGNRRCDNMYPQIIDRLLFAKVQKRLESNKILAGANSATEPYLLTGKAFCGRCETAMVADGGTSRLGKKHYYYVCKQKNKGQCCKKREDKDALELFVTLRVREFLSDPDNVAIAAQDTVNYWERRTGDNGMRSVSARIARANNEAGQLTDSFILARNDLLRANIEKKMAEHEILLKDLYALKAQIELERGMRITKEKITSFVALLLRGDPHDKEYQKKIIDNLVYKAYIYDDSIVAYLNMQGGKDIETISLADTDKAIEDAIEVQSLSLVVHQKLFKFCSIAPPSNGRRKGFCIPKPGGRRAYNGRAKAVAPRSEQGAARVYDFARKGGRKGL